MNNNDREWLARIDEKIADYEEKKVGQEAIEELNALKQTELARLTKGEIQ